MRRSFFLWIIAVGLAVSSCNQSGENNTGSTTVATDGVTPDEALFKTWKLAHFLINEVEDTAKFPITEDLMTFEKSGACRFVYGADKKTELGSWKLPVENELDVSVGEEMVVYKIKKLTADELHLEFDLGEEKALMKFVPGS